ncbi:hypothetical protein [Candidatus Seribacter sulfatis]|uniref:hypothetical protein n=1 Tax=Candidatus Seribacter sulfatis TaxID=3381756 RepID=UPI003899FC7B
MSFYYSTVSMRILACVAFLINIALPTSAQIKEETCEKLKNIGKFYENPESSSLQSAKLFLSYQHQIGYIDGADQMGKNFNDDFEEFRRFWMGISGKWGSYWKFKVVSQLSNDRHNYPASKGGAYRQWGHETFRAANITFDADKFWDFENIDAMEIGYGRRTGRMADEWQRSSTMINCLERSSFSNKLWLYDKEKGNPLAAWVKWKAGTNTFDAAVFSGTYDDYIGGWKDSKVYYGSWLGDFSEQSSYQLHEYWLSYYKQDGNLNQDQLAGGNDWALSLVNRIGDGSWAFHSTLAFGNNGDQANADREGDFGGLVLMPMYWLKEDKLKLVGRYLFQQSDQKEGLRLNSRYAPLADSRDSAIDLNNGRGDKHHAFYLGLNYYLCGENLKLITGIQHDELSSHGANQYRGWTLGSSFRIWF